MTPELAKLRESLPSLGPIIERLELELVDDPSWGEPSDTSYLQPQEREDPDIAANVEAMAETNKLIAWFGRDAEGYLGLWRGPSQRDLSSAPVVRLDTEGQYSIVAATIADYLAIAMPEDEFAQTREALTRAGFQVGFNPDAIWGALEGFDDDPNRYRNELYEENRVKRGLARSDTEDDEAGDDAGDDRHNGHDTESVVATDADQAWAAEPAQTATEPEVPDSAPLYGGDNDDEEDEAAPVSSGGVVDDEEEAGDDDEDDEELPQTKPQQPPSKKPAKKPTQLAAAKKPAAKQAAKKPATKQAAKKPAKAAAKKPAKAPAKKAAAKPAPKKAAAKAPAKKAAKPASKAKSAAKAKPKKRR